MSQDKHLIIEKDGYPLQIESIQTLNDASQQALTSIAAVCGSNTILQGCSDYQQNGVTYISDGIVCIDGRIFQFKGGLKTGGVTIITDKVEDIYDTGDGSAKQMLPVRGFSYVTSTPQGSLNIPWSSFVRLSDLKLLTQQVDTMYNNRTLEAGKRAFTFNAGDILSKSYISFSKPIPDNYGILLSVYIDNNTGVLPGNFIANSYNKTSTQFGVSIERISNQYPAKIEVHWIVYKI